MNSVKAKLGDNGRVIIPASFRHSLHLSKGDDIILHIDNNVISITTPNHALLTLQAKVKQSINSKGEQISLVDDLLAARRLEVKNE